MLFRFFALLLLICLAVTSFTLSPQAISQASQDEPPPMIALINGQVIDGTGAEPIANGGVIIAGENIVWVGSMDEIELTDDMLVIDVEGRTILPGIFNAHTHRVENPLLRQIAWLKEGVTSVCDMGSPLEDMEFLELQTVPDGTPTTRAFAAGPIVTVPGGYPSIYGTQLTYEIESPLEAEAAVLDLKSRGADYIKIALNNMTETEPALSQAQVDALVVAAHEQDMLVSAHVVRDYMLPIAINAGVDVIQHTPSPYRDMAETEYEAVETFRNGETDQIALPAEFEELLLQAIEQGIILVPTLDVYRFSGFPDEDVAMHFEVTFEVVRFYYEHDGIIALGNDVGNPGVEPGMLLGEMLLLEEVGLTPLDILTAGTGNAASACGQADWLGTLAPDMWADVIVVDGDPLTDLNIMDEVVVIIKDGQVFTDKLSE